jgi:two-component system, response regulator RegA
MHNTLLYLEDDETLALVTKRALQKRNFEITHFSSISTFENFYYKNNGRVRNFSHALLDLKLEDGHSLSIINALLLNNPSIKIVVLTGYASIATTVQAIKMGATNYLAKPATIDQIMSAFELLDNGDLKTEFDSQSSLSLKRFEWEHIQQVLAENDGNISATARRLNMHRRTLQRKLLKKSPKG